MDQELLAEHRWLNLAQTALLVSGMVLVLWLSARFLLGSLQVISGRIRRANALVKENSPWIQEARTLAKAVGREDIADSRIGNMLSASPMGSDGYWPAEPVREAIDLFRSKPMIEGFQIGKFNRRGPTSRMPRDGGELERQEAAQYRTWAKAIAYDHPHAARALDTLADGYEEEARWHDEDAARLDWEP